MAGRSVIIIGAGLAGLSTGCYAQLNGYESRIFEHHSLPGGVAAAWKRKDYVIDGGIHFLMGHKPDTALYRMYEQLGIPQSNRFVDLTTFGRFMDEASGRSILVTSDLDRFSADLLAVAPGDARAIEELIASARAMKGLDMSEMGLSRPPELAGPLDQLRDLWSMRHLFRYVIGRFGRPVSEYTRDLDPFLRALIENLFLPEVPVYFLSMLLGMLAGGTLGLIEGGSLDFVGAVEKRYAALGGQVTYKATVEKILVEGDRAVGVRLADGTEHRAGAVVSAADGYSTIFKMLDGRYTSERIQGRYDQWELFRPMVMISCGVAREFPGEPAFSSFQLKQPLTIGGQPIHGLMVRIFNYSPRFAPPGKTVVQVEFETHWDYWNNLQAEDRARYDAQKEDAAAQVLDRLEAHYPGITSQVEVTDVATPYTTWRYTLNHRASYMGWLMTPLAIRTSMERMLPGLGDFYMAGQWVMPGGGVAPCLYSGSHAVQLLCRDDGRGFVTSDPG